MRSPIPTGSVLKACVRRVTPRISGKSSCKVKPFRRVTPGENDRDVLSWCTLPLIEEKDLPVNIGCSKPTSTYHTFSSSILKQ
ncbi:hypothetical protein AMELA_G00053700 [Ameiurus melas]|uniref:Uncharacterized protein n=1 Tax=Ameiurus melas TaxID=219545 RepID=A0A7J6B666_AMEME|nr:hypothetical protein AMELA_G00053700 [Ameiurus melas]